MEATSNKEHRVPVELLNLNSTVEIDLLRLESTCISNENL
jgi:hypothetical protein